MRQVRVQQHADTSRIFHSTLKIIGWSTHGLAGLVPMPDSPAYCASKFGVVGFSRSLTQRAYTDSVRVNCICPEFVNTRMVTDGMSMASDDFKAFVTMKGLLQ